MPDKDMTLDTTLALVITIQALSRDGAIELLDGFIATSNHHAVEEFAAGLKDAMRHLPRHRPTNTSLWDGVQMNVALEAVDAYLAYHKARQGVETQETVNTETHSNDSGNNREQVDCPTCHGTGKVKRKETP